MSSAVVAPGVSEINTTSPGGGRGWSIVRADTNFNSKTVDDRLRALTQNLRWDFLRKRKSRNFLSSYRK